MKFFALAALVAVVSAQDAAVEEEAVAECAEGECMVEDAEGVAACTAEADVEASMGEMECMADEDSSSALFASAATLAVAASMMY